MSQSASFPPPYSPSVGRGSPSEEAGKIVSLTPSNNLPEHIRPQEGSCPSFPEAFAALSGGGALESATRDLSPSTTESDLQRLIAKKPLLGTRELHAALAFITAAPFPMSF